MSYMKREHERIVEKLQDLNYTTVTKKENIIYKIKRRLERIHGPTWVEIVTVIAILFFIGIMVARMSKF